MTAKENVRVAEAAVQEAAARVTEEQVQKAVEICRDSLRQSDPAVLGAVIQALAINFAGLLAARK